MFRKLILSCLIPAASAPMSIGAGPYGTIRVGAWMGGAYTDDNTGAFLDGSFGPGKGCS
jgi:hypothetical protein